MPFRGRKLGRLKSGCGEYVKAHYEEKNDYGRTTRFIEITRCQWCAEGVRIRTQSHLLSQLYRRAWEEHHIGGRTLLDHEERALEYI